jgi:hypothetical protein
VRCSGIRKAFNYTGFHFVPCPNDELLLHSLVIVQRFAASAHFIAISMLLQISYEYSASRAPVIPIIAPARVTLLLLFTALSHFPRLPSDTEQAPIRHPNDYTAVDLPSTATGLATDVIEAKMHICHLQKQTPADRTPWRNSVVAIKVYSMFSHIVLPTTTGQNR